MAELFELSLDELRNEYLTDQLGKHLYDMNCTKQLLKVAEEKAEYRRTINRKLQPEKAL